MLLPPPNLDQVLLKNFVGLMKDECAKTATLTWLEVVRYVFIIGFSYRITEGITVVPD